MKISYYGKARDEKKLRWHADWQRSLELPRLIRLDLETVDGIKHQSIVSVLTSR